MSLGVDCEACGKEPAVGVAAVPGVPVSVAYGAQCLASNVHPLWLLVTNTAINGGIECCADWWRQMVNDTVTALKVDPDEFNRMVDREIAEQFELERSLGA